MVHAEHLIWIAYSILGGFSMPSEVQTVVTMQSLVFTLLVCIYCTRISSTIIIVILWEMKMVLNHLIICVLYFFVNQFVMWSILGDVFLHKMPCPLCVEVRNEITNLILDTTRLGGHCFLGQCNGIGNQSTETWR